MRVVSKSQVSLSDDGTHLVSEASLMGFRPGEWPEIVSVVDERNEGFLFLRSGPILDHGEFGGYMYRTRDSTFGLTVFND